VDLSRRLRLKCHPKMAAWERLIGWMSAASLSGWRRDGSEWSPTCNVLCNLLGRGSTSTWHWLNNLWLPLQTNDFYWWYPRFPPHLCCCWSPFNDLFTWDESRWGGTAKRLAVGMCHCFIALSGADLSELMDHVGWVSASHRTYSTTCNLLIKVLIPSGYRPNWTPICMGVDPSHAW
jgi:hypothetical protein